MKIEYNKHEYKMYCITWREMDAVNQGIQCAHGMCEYIRKHWNEDSLQQWLIDDKTLVYLNGGTPVMIDEIIKKFDECGVVYETFKEPDMHDEVTSVVVIADERVWDRETYPSFDRWSEGKREAKIYSYLQERLDNSLKNYNEIINDAEEKLKKEYEEFVGGKDIVSMKEVLNNLRTI